MNPEQKETYTCVKRNLIGVLRDEYNTIKAVSYPQEEDEYDDKVIEDGFHSEILIEPYSLDYMCAKELGKRIEECFNYGFGDGATYSLLSDESESLVLIKCVGEIEYVAFQDAWQAIQKERGDLLVA